MNFNELGLDPSILKALHEAGYTEPTPIQQKAIPPALSGRDLLGCAQTGTGKTAAFALPILQHMGKPEGGERPVRALVLTPTRELALQIYENFCQYGRYTGRIAAVVYGGVSQVPQVEALRRGADVLIATPGRLWDLMGQKLLDIGKVECFVLDEADRMLDMGFINDVKRIIKFLPHQRQTLLFSATMPGEIAELADSLLHKPVHVAITPAATPVELIEQGVYFAEKLEKRDLLQAVLRVRGVPQTLVFTRTKHGADRVARDLNRAGISAKSLHGDKSQGARQTALREFKEYKIACLVATDIAARGLDISELPLVINFDLPNIPETYVHRIGRTGRAGLEGTALSFCAQDERPYLKDIEKLTGVKIPVLERPEGELPAVPEQKKVVSAPPQERALRTGRRKAAATVARLAEKVQGTAKNSLRGQKQAPQRNGSASQGKPAKAVKAVHCQKTEESAEPARKPQKSRSIASPTQPLAVKYPKRTSGRSTGGRRTKEDLSMDISTPRLNQLPEATAARVRAKVLAKIAERQAAKREPPAASANGDADKKTNRSRRGRHRSSHTAAK